METFALFVALLAALPSIGRPAQSAPAPSGFVNLSFEVGGEQRTASLYVPPQYDRSKAWPLIGYLHGRGQGDNDGNAINDWMERQAIVRAIR